MKRIELEVEHTFKNRFVSKHRISNPDGIIVIGSSKEADIRLVGDKVAGVHATLEMEDGHWRLNDMGSETGTWIKKQPIVEIDLKTETTATIGQHSLNFRPVTIERDLFTEKVEGIKGGTPFHEIVIKKGGLLMDVHLLDWGRPITLHVGQEKVELSCPANDQPIITRKGNITIYQQKVLSTAIESTPTDTIKHVVDPDMRKSLLFTFASTMMIVALMAFWPEAPEEAPNVVDVKMVTNKFTKVLFDGKMARQRQKASEQAQEKIRTSVKVVGNVNTQAPRPQNTSNTSGQKAAVRIDQKLRAAGLGQLIGKIAKRRAPTGMFVVGQGVTAGSQASGMATTSIAGTITDANRAGIKGGTGRFKLGGVSTSGRAGGDNSYLGSAGLGGAGVGTGSVGVLEEETEIEGGLAKDVIARVINENIGHIRYCYERQLSANPELYGKVLVKFTIGAAGSVATQSIGTSTLNNANVEGCILRRVSGWKFPKPTGGTSVLVSYPFLFKSTN